MNRRRILLLALAAQVLTLGKAHAQYAYVTSDAVVEQRANSAAPLSRWTIVATFPTQKECEAHRANPWERCIASDDPRLKEKR
jgi:hypothetical protein